MFPAPNFELWSVVFTGAGAAVFWGKWGRNKLRPFLLCSLMDAVMNDDNKWRHALEFVIFIGFGILFGVGLTQPQTVVQAVSAGLGWTGLVATTGKN